jgi:hypothetical protein
MFIDGENILCWAYACLFGESSDMSSWGWCWVLLSMRLEIPGLVFFLFLCGVVFLCLR